MIGQLGGCDEEVMTVLTECLNDISLQADVLKTMSLIVSRGCVDDILFAQTLLSHRDANVRAGAAAVLANAITHDDQRMIAALCRNLSDTGIVRVATVAALQNFKGNAHAISAVRQYLVHDDFQVRCSAVQGLSRV